MFIKGQTSRNPKKIQTHHLFLLYFTQQLISNFKGHNSSLYMCCHLYEYMCCMISV